MSFKLRNALSTFQPVMDIIPSTVKREYVFLYIDDTVILSRTPKELIKHTRIVLQLLGDAGLALKLRMLAFFTNRAGYSGNILRLGPIEAATHTAGAIGELKTATTATEFRSVLLSCDVFWRFFLNSGSIWLHLSGSRRKYRQNTSYFLGKTSFRISIPWKKNSYQQLYCFQCERMYT